MGQHIYFGSIMHKIMRGGRPSLRYFVQSTVKNRVHEVFRFSMLAILS